MRREFPCCETQQGAHKLPTPTITRPHWTQRSANANATHTEMSIGQDGDEIDRNGTFREDAHLIKCIGFTVWSVQVNGYSCCGYNNGKLLMVIF